MHVIDLENGGRRVGAGVLICFAILFALVSLPVVFTESLPLFDYPNHMARMHILAEAGQSPVLNRFYEVDWRPLPNLAMDAVVPLLGRFMPLEWAGKIFVLGIFVLLTSGTVMLHRVLFGRWSYWPLLGFLFVYNRILAWGFLNFLFGIGLCLHAVAIWLVLRERNRPAAVGAGSLLALLLYFSHLFAFGAYGLIIGAIELGCAMQHPYRLQEAVKRWPVAAVQFAAPIAIAIATASGDSLGDVHWPRLIRKLDLLYSLMQNYNDALDIASLLAVVVLFGTGFRYGFVKASRIMTVPLIAIGVCFVLMPSRFGTGSAVDHRVPVLLGFVIAASTDLRLVNPGRAAFLAWGMAGLFLVRLAVVWWFWAGYDRIYHDFLAGLDQVPAGSRVALGYSARSINIFRSPPPLAHFPNWAVARRDAFVPTLFTFRTQQPVAMKPEFRELADAAEPWVFWSAFIEGEPGAVRQAGKIIDRYDYIIFLAPSSFEVPPSPMLELRLRLPYVQIFALRKG